MMCQAVKKYCSPLHVIGFAVAVCCFLFKQNCCPTDMSNTADRTMLMRHSERFTDICPFSSMKKHPVSRIWEFMVEIIGRLQGMNGYDRYEEVDSNVALDGIMVNGDHCTIL